MKKTILVSALGFLAITANAQKIKETDVPAPVKAIFVKQYPAAKAEAVKKMVNWVMTTGQGLNKGLEFTSIPQATAQKVIQTVNQTVVAKG